MPHPGHFTPGNDLVTTVKDWVGPMASLDGWGKPCLHWDDPETVQPVVSSFSDYAIPVHAAEVT